MSASTPDRTRSSRNSKWKARAEFPFWSVSVVLHVLLLGVLVFIVPVREIVLVREKRLEPEIITRGDELEAIIGKIRDRTAERLRARVALLEAGQDRMAVNFGIINAHFQPFAAQQRATARGRLDKYAGDALARQTTLVDMLDDAHKTRRVDAVIETAYKHMSRILTAQEEIRRGVLLLEIGGESLVERQKKAEDDQFNANQFYRWLDGDVTGIADDEEWIAKLGEEKETHRTQIAELTEALASRSEDLEAREREFQELEERERNEKDRDKKRELRQRLQESRQARESAKRVKREGEQALKRTEDALQRIETQSTQREEQLGKRHESVETHLDSARNVQTAAHLAQKAVVEEIERLLGEEATE